MKFVGLSILAMQLLILAGCTGMQTTKPGVVGVTRTQYMFDPYTAKDLNRSYAYSYQAAVRQADRQGRVLTDTAQGKWLQSIALRVVMQVGTFNPAAEYWDWDINLIKVDQINANCGPGGKIIVYSGLLDKIKPTDDELAVVLAHEAAHALRQHTREQASSKAMFEVAGTLSASALKAGALGKSAITKLLDTGVGLPFSRRDETEADLIGLELAARAGYDPRAAITLWQKMEAESKGSMMPAFLSTHPATAERIRVISETIPKVLPLYLAARRNGPGLPFQSSR